MCIEMEGISLTLGVSTGLLAIFAIVVGLAVGLDTIIVIMIPVVLFVTMLLTFGRSPHNKSVLNVQTLMPLDDMKLDDIDWREELYGQSSSESNSEISESEQPGETDSSKQSIHDAGDDTFKPCQAEVDDKDAE